MYDAPEKQKFSHWAFPAISAPASSSRVMIGASMSETNPCITAEPFIIGVPAIATLSLTATRLPLSGPSGAPRIEHFHVHAPYGFSSGPGR